MGKNKVKYSVSDAADILHIASSLYYASNIQIDYGTGEKYTPVEVHMLKYIVDHPGLTVTQLSQDWDKSKAAISQTMKSFDEKGLIIKKDSAVNNHIKCYYASKKGLELDKTHRKYDNRVFAWTYDKMIKETSIEDVEKCFEMLELYIQIRRGKHYRAKEND